MRLILAEADRLRTRRMTLVALILVVLGVAAFQLAVRSQVTPPSAAEVAEGRAAYEESRTYWEQNHVEDERRCLEEGNAPEICVAPEPRLEDFVRQAAAFAEVAPLSITLSTYLVALAAFLVAGSFIGAEFSTGSIANWLTFVPDRLRVFASKFVVVVAYAALVAALVTGLGLAATAWIADAAGSDMSGARGVLLQAARSLIVPVALAVVGFCLGLLLRQTSAVIGVMLGYLLVYFTRTILSTLLPWVGELARWSPEGNLAAILEKKYTYYIYRVDDRGQFESLERSIDLNHGLAYWGVLLISLIVISGVVFRRRDVS